MRDRIQFLLGGQQLEINDCAPTATVLDWLRGPARRKGTKEGCAEGDCGACTVVLAELDANLQLQFRAVNACILFLPMLDGKALFTVEDLATAEGQLHPVQQAMVEQHGSQCGFCTPGFVMSLFAGFHTAPRLAPQRAELDGLLAGNLCRCTGYAPILRAAQQALVPGRRDALSARYASLRKQLLDLQTSPALRLHSPGGRFDAPLDAGQLAALLAEHPDVTLVAGATDVGLWVTKQLRELPHLVHTARVAELQELGVDAQDDRLRIGAAVTYSQAFDSVTSRWPAFAAVLQRLAGLQVRNSGTIGGNIANGSPIGDMPPGLIALGARLVLRSRAGQREIACEDFFIDYGRQDLRPGEFLQTILLPPPDAELLFRTWKISKRFEQDISAVCGAFALRIVDDMVVSARVAFGGMAATPRRATRCETALQGQPWNEATLAAASQALDQDYQPISDWRASADYRRRTARNLLRRLYLESQGEVAALPDKYGDSHVPA